MKLCNAPKILFIFVLCLMPGVSQADKLFFHCQTLDANKNVIDYASENMELKPVSMNRHQMLVRAAGTFPGEVLGNSYGVSAYFYISRRRRGRYAQVCKIELSEEDALSTPNFSDPTGGLYVPYCNMHAKYYDQFAVNTTDKDGNYQVCSFQLNR